MIKSKHIFSLLLITIIGVVDVSALHYSQAEMLDKTYQEVVHTLKQQLTSYFNQSGDSKVQYPIPTSNYTLVQIFNQDGSNNQNLQNQFEYKIGTVWDEQGRIKVVTWISKQYYELYWTNNQNKFPPIQFPKDKRPIVTVAGQIRGHFLANSSLLKIDSEKQAHILVAQLLGLPVPQINGSIVTDHIFVQFWIRPSQLFRMVKTAQIKKDDISHGLNGKVKDSFNPDRKYYTKYIWRYNSTGDSWESFPALVPMTQPHMPYYLNSFKNDIQFRLMGLKDGQKVVRQYPYPFTGLGYSFNWHGFDINNKKQSLKSKQRVGMSTFVVKSESQYELAGVYETYRYVTRDDAKSFKDIINSNVPPNFMSPDLPFIF